MTGLQPARQEKQKISVSYTWLSRYNLLSSAPKVNHKKYSQVTPSTNFEFSVSETQRLKFLKETWK